MTRRSGRAERFHVGWFAALCAFVAVVISGCGGGPSKSGAPSASDSSARVAATRAESDARLEFLQDRAKGDPLDVFSLNLIAVERTQRFRESGDVSELSRAADALRRSLEVRMNDNYEGLALSAGLDVTRHDYAAALDHAKLAIAQKPSQAYAYGALGDAMMGLGRYEDAAAAYEQMVTIEPDLPAFSRQALLFTLTGHPKDAESLWSGALDRAANDDVPEHAAWVHAQIANFDFLLGDIDGAETHYEASLAVFPQYVHALAGLGRVAAANGDYSKAMDYYNRAINVVPIPEYVIALGDVYAALGDAKQASAQYDLVGAIDQLYTANGVNLDLQIALFNADHGRDIAVTVARAKSAYAQQPSVQAADVLAWTLFKAGEVEDARSNVEQALRTNTIDPLILFHAGMIYKASGDNARASTLLARVEQQAPHFSVLYSETARQALEDTASRVQRS